MTERKRQSLIKKLSFYCPGNGCHFEKRGVSALGKDRYKCVATGCNRVFIPLDKPIDFTTWTDIDKILDQKTHKYFQWKQNFDKLKAFYEKNGHTWASQLARTKQERTFGSWVALRRRLIRRNKHHPLKKELLESVNLSLDYHDCNSKTTLAIKRKRYSQRDLFPNQLEKVLKWKKKHGSWPTYRKTRSLGRIVDSWRSNGYLYDDQMDQLDALKFVWDLKDEQFLKKIERIKEFKQRHGGYFLKTGQKNTPYDRDTSAMIAILRYRLADKDWQREIVKNLQLGHGKHWKSKEKLK